MYVLSSRQPVPYANLKHVCRSTGTRDATPVQSLPRELSAPVAATVAASLINDGGCTRRFQNLTLKNCMLVSQSFAYEFRPYLYETLFIVDTQMATGQEAASDRLCDHARTMQEHPEYQRLVKKVIIAVDVDPAVQLRRSLVNFLEFPSWLEGLSSVASVAFGCLSMASQAPSFFDFHAASIQALFNLCSCPSIQSLSFSGFSVLYTPFITHAPNLSYLALNDCSPMMLSWWLVDMIMFLHHSQLTKLATVRIEAHSEWRDGEGWEQYVWGEIDKALSDLPSLEMVELRLHHSIGESMSDEEVQGNKSFILPELSSKANLTIEAHTCLAPVRLYRYLMLNQHGIDPVR
ncbi:hypothetical protein BKA70DRAFT_1230848 [Coprinopsis sp. MPI-PUGE-AT-0042]|nr:hypothetical protein BKA70DRAFT_1230848 [Coprinopsis sp. MPI-PUGE-AT-0042]